MTPARAILLSGLVVAVLDGLDAVVATWWFGGSPARMFQSIAGGILGREAALAGGVPTALLGVACHAFIATAVSAVYVGASRRISLLVEYPLACGALFGVAVWAVMRWGVVPLSARGPMPPLTTFSLVNGVLAHVLLVGIPAALIARRAGAAPARHPGVRLEVRGGAASPPPGG